MPEWLGIATPLTPVHITGVVVRLIVAAVLGAGVAWIHRRTRGVDEETESFTVTLVLLSTLIAMVTQVVGDNVARAFSLVGALSIVRFRTVVRDTQDTAYVIFAVVVGMAMGAANLVIAAGGLGVVGAAAGAMALRRRQTTTPAGATELPFCLTVRLALGIDPEAVVGAALHRLQVARQLITVATARQGMSIEVAYRAAHVTETTAAALVSSLNTTDGVQSVTLQRM